MSLQTKIIVLLATLLVGFGSGFGVRAYIAGKEAVVAENANLKADKEEFRQYIAKSETAVQQYNALQNKLNTLDTTNTQVLNEKLTENARLRGDLSVARSMRLKGASCVAGSTEAKAGTSGSVGGDLQVDYSPETRRAFWDLRDSAIKDNAVILYYQGYVDALGLTATPPTK